MRVMVVRPGADYSIGDMARGWVMGLRACGVEVVDFRLDTFLGFYLAAQVDGKPAFATPVEASVVAADHLIAMLYRSWPDVVLVVTGYEIPPPAFDEMRSVARVVLHHTESPYQDDHIAKMAGAAHLHLCNDPSGAEALRSIGASATYVPHGFDPTVHYADGRERDGRLVFVGTAFEERRALFAGLGAPTLLAGGFWKGLDHLTDPTLPIPLPNDRTADLYRSHALGVNLYRRSFVDRPELADAGWAMGPRRGRDGGVRPALPP